MNPVFCIVRGVTTEYDECDTWNVAAYPNAHLAEVHAACAQQVLETFLARYPPDALTWAQHQWALMRLTTYGTALLGNISTRGMAQLRHTRYIVDRVVLNEAVPPHDMGWDVPGRWPPAQD